MKHRALMLALAVVCTAGVANAQTAPGAQTAGAAKEKYIEFTTGPTFGHKVGGSVGAEGAYFLTPRIGVFAEAGWMSNVVTSGTQADADLIASSVGLRATAKTRLTYFDVGVNYRIPMSSERFHPYALLGFGFAHPSNQTKFFDSSGADVTGQLLSNYGVQLGTDLAGSYTKPYVTLGGGVHIPIRKIQWLSKQWFGDVSYRYGYLPKETSDNADISPIHTNRLQFGFGMRF